MCTLVRTSLPRLLGLAALALAITAQAENSRDPHGDPLFRAVLDQTIAIQNDPSLLDPEGLGAEGALENLWELADRPDALLVGLLDYELAGITGALLDEYITARRGEILPLLKAKLGAPVRCHVDYAALCVRDIGLLNEHVRILIDYIEHGEIACIEVIDCVAEPRRLDGSRSPLSYQEFGNLLYSMKRQDRSGDPDLLSLGVFDVLLRSIDRDGVPAAFLLAEMLDYDFGPDRNGYLFDRITARGKDMLPELRRKAGRLLECARGYDALCRSSVERRNRDIGGLIAAIEHGRDFCPTGASCGVETSRRDIRAAVALDPYFRAVLKERVRDPMPSTSDGRKVIARIRDVMNQSKNRDLVLVALLDYDLGAPSTDFLDRAIIERGDAILPALRDRLVWPLDCGAYPTYCVASPEDRNARITSLIAAIENG